MSQELLGEQGQVHYGSSCPTCTLHHHICAPGPLVTVKQPKSLQGWPKWRGGAQCPPHWDSYHTRRSHLCGEARCPAGMGVSSDGARATVAGSSLHCLPHALAFCLSYSYLPGSLRCGSLSLMTANKGAAWHPGTNGERVGGRAGCMQKQEARTPSGPT